MRNGNPKPMEEIYCEIRKKMRRMRGNLIGRLQVMGSLSIEYQKAFKRLKEMSIPKC